MNIIMVGDSVGWTSSIGWKNGIVKKIVLSKNANLELVPWIDIEYEIAHGAKNTCRICATESNLKAMRVELLN